MSEPILKVLGQFTPDQGKLDRDALLFAAGKASAKPNRPWINLVGVLLVSQILTLVLLWPTSPGQDKSIIAHKRETEPARESKQPSPESITNLVSQQEFWPNSPPTNPPLSEKEMIPTTAPLRASSFNVDIKTF